MNKKEFAIAIAEKTNGKVVEVNKNGVIMTGVSIPIDSCISATTYVDDMYENGISVEEAATKAVNAANASKPTLPDISFMDAGFEEVADKLSIKLYGEGKVADDVIKKSALDYGFEDLNLVPVLNLGQFDNGDLASVKVTEALVQKWGKSVDEIIEKAMENSKSDVCIKAMGMILAENFGEDYVRSIGMSMEPETSDQLVVTNKAKVLGASAILFVKEKLNKFFPDGYFVLPSSIHEVLVVRKTPTMTLNEMTEMVKNVNATQVHPTEQLANHAYMF